MDGSNLYKLAEGEGTTAWSHDAASITFDQAVDGNTDLYIVAADGGKPRRLTSEPSIDGTPEFSRDGRWLYFTSTRAAHTAQIWRMPAGGGPAVQITRNGGFRPRESPDGLHLYYLDRLVSVNGRGKLMRTPVTGGDETVVLDDIGGWTWDASDVGILFSTSDKTGIAVDVLRYGDLKTIRIGRLDFNPARTAVGWAVSRDGRWLATTQLDRLDSDLMLVDNFR